MNPKPGLILPPLPENATPADYGGQAYRLVCSACHGDVGQGLTAEWLAAWPEEDQNCWRSKCHAANHPPDGFELPHYVPQIIGPNKLARFETGLELHDYIQATMPWQDPGYLADEEFWNITAYLIRENGIDPMLGELTPELAAQIAINPSRVVSGPESAAAQPSETAGPPWIPWVGGVLVIAIGAILFLRARRAYGPRARQKPLDKEE